MSFPVSKFYWIDGQRASPISMVDYYSRCTKFGVVGEPQLATAEKGRAWFEAAVSNLVEFVREFRTFDIRERVDHH
jgi:creatinine amidohydrolase/Fe(II)-dependent formamide hydrolase-like protein